MNAKEEARRATLREFVHPGCERVALDQLVSGDRAWIVVAMSGVRGERYPTRWLDVVIDRVNILIPGESAMVHFLRPGQPSHPSEDFVLAVFDYVTIGANRAIGAPSQEGSG